MAFILETSKCNENGNWIVTFAELVKRLRAAQPLYLSVRMGRRIPYSVYPGGSRGVHFRGSPHVPRIIERKIWGLGVTIHEGDKKRKPFLWIKTSIGIDTYFALTIAHSAPFAACLHPRTMVAEFGLLPEMCHRVHTHGDISDLRPCFDWSTIKSRFI